MDHEKSNKLYWASSKQTLTASLKNLRMHLNFMEPTPVHHMLENHGLQIRKCSNQLCWEGGRQARQLNTEHTSAGPCRHQQVRNLFGNFFLGNLYGFLFGNLCRQLQVVNMISQASSFPDFLSGLANLTRFNPSFFCLVQCSTRLQSLARKSNHLLNKWQYFEP